jgi:hypothetical protein
MAKRGVASPDDAPPEKALSSRLRFMRYAGVVPEVAGNAAQPHGPRRGLLHRWLRPRRRDQPPVRAVRSDTLRLEWTLFA